ncbi:MAG: amino acid ABC transporter substrate-binding protein [Rhodobacteraceae bacterium]|nr:amino acid ABC transporter substrate-binding protein [Paracoccaceae bacterium]
MKMLKTTPVAALVATLAPLSVAAQDNLVEEIRDRGSLRTCHAEAFPWAVVNPENNQWEGTDIEATKNLAETLGVEHELVPSTWGTLIPSLEAGTCDIVMAPLFRTAERAVRVLFSEPSGFETKTIVAADAASVSSYGDLDVADKTVLVVSGSADESFASRYFENAEVRAMVTDKVATLLVDVASGRADALLVDSSTARKLVSENDTAPVGILEEDNPLDPQGYSYAIRKGEYHFLNFVNVWQENAEQQGLKDAWSAMFSN